MKRISALAGVCALAFAIPAEAYYYQRTAPEYAPDNLPVMNVGETRVEQGTPGTLLARSFTSADFKCTSDRWGTHTVHFFWDGPPDVLVPGQKFTSRLGWSIAQKWTQFSPLEGGFSHLDWNSEQYLRSLKYGYGDGDAPASGYDAMAFTVPADHDPTELVYSTHVHCGGAAVRVKWVFKKIEGSAPVANTMGAPQGASAPQPDASAPTQNLGWRSAGSGAQGSASPAASSSWHVPAGNSGTEALPAPTEPSIYRNGADGSVSNGASAPTIVAFPRPTLIAQLMTYHFGFRGRPGTLALRAENGTSYGPWPAAGAGSPTSPNVYWWVRPNIVVPAGRYQVIDSDPATWSQEATTHDAGIVIIWGKAQ